MEALSRLAMAAALGPSPTAPPVPAGSRELPSQEELQDEGTDEVPRRANYDLAHTSVCSLSSRRFLSEQAGTTEEES